MVFSSPVFLMLFLPVFLVIYYILPWRAKSLVILLGSYAFYAWWRLDFLVLFFGATYWSYWTSLRMIKASTARLKKKWLTIGVVGNLSTLGYFKYANFGVDSFNTALQSFGMSPAITGWEAVILPIGISFYIFQAVSYLIDVYRGDAEVADSFLDFAAFIALFPQLIAGPVLRYKDIAHQFHERTHTWDKFNEGALRFFTGFCKKVLIADTLAVVADMMFALDAPTMAESWLGILAYSAQLYFDFSGYSDMAIGLGLMMGFYFPENFNHPYISRSITEFWRRWHISLSSWLKDYLYIPLGGNRKGVKRTYINLLLTMVLGGLWHGANWTFVLWGAWHGGILALERAFSGKSSNPYPRLIALPLTFVMVMIGWVLFRATSVTAAFEMYAGMVGSNGYGLTHATLWQITPLHWVTLLAAYAIVFFAPKLYGENHREVMEPSWAAHLTKKRQLVFSLLMVIAVMKMVAQSFSPFLYFQF
jgi:alginate O-acetyltransferase complex protein AlgI